MGDHAYSDPTRISERFLQFAATECRYSSPLYAHLSERAAADPEILALMDAAPPTQRIPNLLFAAVQYLLLRSNESHKLAAFYPSLAREPALGDPFPVFRNFCLAHKEALREIIRTHNTQTNEVRRAALLSAALAVADNVYGHPAWALADVGTSAGANLLLDAYRYRYHGGGRVAAAGAQDAAVEVDCELVGPGRPPLPTHPPDIRSRMGVDLQPLDANDPDHALWLEACIWPEHLDRRRLLSAALEQVGRVRPSIRRGDVFDILPQSEAEWPQEWSLCVMHSAMMMYLPRAQRSRFGQMLQAIAARRSVAWISFESRGVLPEVHLDALPTRQEGVGVLVLRLWTPDRHEERVLGFGHMHGRWLEWLA